MVFFSAFWAACRGCSFGAVEGSVAFAIVVVGVMSEFTCELGRLLVYK